MSHLWDIWICQAEPVGYLDALREWDIYETYGTCTYASNALRANRHRGTKGAGALDGACRNGS